MNTISKIFLLALIIGLASCTKTIDTSASNTTTTKTDKVAGINWVVTYFSDSGKDETSDYSGYTFDFLTGDVLQAVSGFNTYTGSWTIGNRSSSDDNSSNKLNISISGDKQMDHLQHSWLIVKLTDTEIWLKDDNASSGEELRFGR
jgi:hypothetical protein